MAIWYILWPFGIFYGKLIYCNLVVLWQFGKFYGHFVYFLAIWYILWPFGIFFPALVCCIKKNLATLVQLIKIYISM
jgi:hypothetical protein